LPFIFAIIRTLLTQAQPAKQQFMQPTAPNNPQQNTKTPQDVVNGFFENYSPDGVEGLLWETYRGYAVNGPKNSDGTSVMETEIAALFDGIKDLVAAVHALKAAGMLANPPVIA
jgi:hypothetical protein